MPTFDCRERFADISKTFFAYMEISVDIEFAVAASLVFGLIPWKKGLGVSPIK